MSVSNFAFEVVPVNRWLPSRSRDPAHVQKSTNNTLLVFLRTLAKPDRFARSGIRSRTWCGRSPSQGFGNYLVHRHHVRPATADQPVSMPIGSKTGETLLSIGTKSNVTIDTNRFTGKLTRRGFPQRVISPDVIPMSRHISPKSQTAPYPICRAIPCRSRPLAIPHGNWLSPPC
jgi:hypothetical protein